MEDSVSEYRLKARWAPAGVVALGLWLGACASQAPPERPAVPTAWGDPLLPVAATVQGAAIHTRDAGELRGVVLLRLTDAFARKEGIVVADDERDAYIRHVDAALRARGMTPADMRDSEERAAREQVAVLFVRQWKVHRALFERYGGRVGYQQGGPEPLDALRTLAQESVASGELLFRDVALESRFWSYFRNDAIHSFYPPGAAASVFRRPWWEQSR